MSNELNIIPFDPQPQTNGEKPGWARECSLDAIRGYLDGKLGEWLPSNTELGLARSPRCTDTATNGAQKHMWYSPRRYASIIVSKCGFKIAGWPPKIPFMDLSNIGGGALMLAELRRRCDLPDGDPNKLRFEPATREDRYNAARDPESVHPTPQHLTEVKAKAMMAAARDAARSAAEARANSYHPENMQFVGRPSLSLSTRDVPKAQRRDTGQRRARASDSDPRVTKKRTKRGITSMPYILPGTRRTGRGSGSGSGGGSGGGGGERAAKRQRVSVDDYPLQERITQYDLSSDFGGELTDPDSDPIESASGSADEAD